MATEEISAALVAQQIRAQAAEVRRLGELYAQTEQARIAAQREILELEEQALEIEKNLAETKEQQLKVDEKLKDNAHAKNMLAKREYEAAEQRRRALEQENSTSARISKTVQALQGYWMEVTAAVYAMVAAVQAADAAMQKAFTQRTMMANLPFSINAARTATMGLVEDTELARLAIEAQRLGVVKSEEDFAKLAQAASKLGMSVGKEATESVSDLIGALGRGETELLDNLGVTLRTAEAQRLFAQQLGISEKALTEEQKAQAFRTIGLQKALEASEKVRISTTESEKSWISARQEYERLARETLPKLTENMGSFWETLGETAKGVGLVVDAIDSMSKAAERLGLSSEGLDKFDIAFGNVFQRIDQVHDLMKSETPKDALPDILNAGKAYADLKKKIVDVAQAQQAQQQEAITTKKDELDALDFQIELMEAQGVPAKEINTLLEQRANLYIDILNQQGKSKEAEEAIKKEHVRQAKAAAAAAKARGKGQTEAERLRAADEGIVQALADQVKWLEVESQLRDTQLDDAGELAKLRLDAAHAALELERNVLLVTKAKNSVERQQIENKLAALDRQEELLTQQFELEEKLAANDLVSKAREETLRWTKLEVEETRQLLDEQSKVVDLDLYRMRANEQSIRHRGEMEAARAQTEMGKLQALQAMEADLHANRLAQLDAEHQRTLRELEAREAALTVLDTSTDEGRLAALDESRQLAHDREIARLEYEMQVRQAMDAEEARLFEAKQARLQQTIANVQTGIDSLSQLSSEVTGFTGFMLSESAAAADAETRKYIEALQARGQAQKESIQREIDAAKGNTALQNQLRAKQAKQERELQAKIEKAERQHQERREKQERRFAGGQLILQGFVDLAKSISEFASFNYVKGALLLASSAFNFTQGGILMSGNLPGGGGGGGGAGAGGGFSAGAGPEFSEASNVPGSIPGQAAARESATARNGATERQAGSTVVIQGDVIGYGAIDDDFADNLARKLDERSYSRE